MVPFKCIVLQQKVPQFAAGVKRYVDLMYCVRADTTQPLCRVWVQHKQLVSFMAMQHIARVQGHDTCSISGSCGVNVAAVVVGATRV